MTSPDRRRVEDRLADAFAAVDRQVDLTDLDVMCDRPAPVLHRTWLLAAAGVAALIGVAALALVLRDRDTTMVAGPGPTVAPAEFNAAAGPLCRDVDQSLNGLGPQFVTAEAYTVVAGQLRETLDRAATGLIRLRPPADDVWLTQEALAKVRAARAAADDVDAAVARDDLEGADTAWSHAFGLAYEALYPLGDHGVERCPTTPPVGGP